MASSSSSTSSNSSSPPPSSNSPPPPSSSPPPPAKSPPPPDKSPPPPTPSSPQSPPPPSSQGSNSPPPPPPANQNGSSSSPPPPPPPPSSPPPPPSHARRPPPPPISHKSSSHKNSSTQIELSTPAIAAIAAGGFFLLAIMLACILCCVNRKKRKEKEKKKSSQTAYDQMGYYRNDYTSNNYYRGGQPPDRTVTIPPPSGPWGAPPPPPSISSGEMSSNFSGPYLPPLPPPHPTIALGFNRNTFTYDDLAVATEGFSPSCLLGQGGFGYVYKGVLPNGKEIAVKSLKSGSGQGEREFQAEVDIISRVHHRHLVSLVGYCISGNQRLLVYEFIANNTLEFHLHGNGRPCMDWPTRLRIALGSARGLAYLHEDCHPRIIHRDIKAANILLEYNFEAKVADFGLAKLSTDNHTHVSTRVMGTFGYLAPEYASSGKLTEKSDVFSFGVMLLELITGKRPVDSTDDEMDDCLVEWARPLLLRAVEDGNCEGLIDRRLENNYNYQEMMQMIGCAAASVRHSARRRPKMSQIVRALEGDVSFDDLNEGVKPGRSGMFGSGSSSDFDGSARRVGMSTLKKTPEASSQEFGSREFQSSGEHDRRE